MRIKIISNKLVINRPAPRILLVDDDLFHREIMSRTLRSSGYDLISACCGAETALGILTLLENPPEVLVADYDMGTMNGNELIVAVKEQPRFAKMKIILASGDKDEVEHDHGQDNSLRKPFAGYSLLDVMFRTYPHKLPKESELNYRLVELAKEFADDLE